jgi:hypothetical protein
MNSITAWKAALFRARPNGVARLRKAYASYGLMNFNDQNQPCHPERQRRISVAEDESRACWERSFAGAQDDRAHWLSQTLPILVIKNHVYRQQDCRGVLGVVIDGLLGNAQLRCGS